MKKLITFVIMFIGFVPAALACKLCEEQQPSWLKGAVHGPGPKGPLDYGIMIVSIIIVLVVLFYSIKFLVKPGEKDASHIKYSILNPNEPTYGKK